VLYVDFGGASTGGLGLRKYDGTAWPKKSISSYDAEGMCVAGNVLYVDFGSAGLFKYDGTALDPISAANPQAMIGVGNTLFVDLGGTATGGNGLYKYELGALRRISVNDAEEMCAVNLR
jgi:hypothetical protein